jgi:light-regulated signal transduction histidine kinase (bacteriophytochrome)
MKKLLSGEISSYQMEKRYFHQEGHIIWINLSVSLIRDENHNPLYFVALIENISDRKRAELAIAQLNEALEKRIKERTAQLEQLNTILLATATQLEKRNKELDQFAYVASHDLKAPLRAIANLSVWIEEDLEDKLDDETRHNMNLLRGRIQRLENLINGLLAYSRVGRLKSEPEQVQVALLLAEIIDSIDVPPDFNIQIVGKMPTLVTQVTPLQQVFSNLIINAIEHHHRSDGKVIISVREQEQFYEFAVTDDGLGIHPQYHDKIFTIFQTLQPRDKKESTGIGLSIVKKAVENQGGKIILESQLGQGTTFRFTWRKVSI